MFPSAVPLMAMGSPGAQYVGSTQIASSASPNQALAWPAGAAESDLALIFADFQGTPPSGNGFAAGLTLNRPGYTKIDYHWPSLGYWAAVWWKPLTASDVLTPPTVQGTNWATAQVITRLYRGPSAVALRSGAGEVGEQLTLPGFTRGPSCRGLVSFVSDRDPSATAMGPPAAWEVEAAIASAGFAARAAHLLQPAGYPNGDPIVWTGFPAAGDGVAGFEQIGLVLELM